MAKKKETGITTITKEKKAKVVKTLEEKIVSDIIESEKAEDKIISDLIEEEKKKVLVCPFCGEINDHLIGRDETSSWCPRCGKCYSVNWQYV